jgi:8-oxo-dGTP diphosphatase
LKCCPLCGAPVKNVPIGGRDRVACAACEFVHWDNPKPVTATLIPMDGGLVLVKRKVEPFIDHWCLPGGFIENAEHPEESAIREVLEETGLTVELHRLLSATSPGRGINVIILFYLARAASGNLIPGDDASDVRVFQKHELPENIAFELHRRIIHRFFAENGSFTAAIDLLS